LQFESCKPVATPLLKISTEETSEIGKAEINFPYRQAIGALMFLMCSTRPDLAYSVGYLSRKLENPSTDDITRIKRVLRYVAGTLDKGILYKPDYKSCILECYSDADYAGCISTRRSTSGVVVLHSGGIISWISQRQPIVATSTTESEIIAATEATKETVWLARLFSEIVGLKDIPIIHIDNNAAVKLALNPEFHRRTKHIDVRFFYIREKVADKSVSVQQISTEIQLADIMTKPLDRARFNDLSSMLGLCFLKQNNLQI